MKFDMNTIISFSGGGRTSAMMCNDVVSNIAKT